MCKDTEALKGPWGGDRAHNNQLIFTECFNVGWRLPCNIFPLPSLKAYA